MWALTLFSPLCVWLFLFVYYIQLHCTEHAHRAPRRQNTQTCQHTHTHWFGTRYINLLCMTKSLSSSRCLGSTWVFYFLTLCPFFPFPSVSLASFSLSVHVSLCPSTICVIFRPGVGLVHGYSVSYGRYVSSLAMSCSAVEHSLTEIYIHRHKVILYLF